MLWTRFFWLVTGPMNVCCVHCRRPSGPIKCGEFLDLASNYWLKRDSGQLDDNVEITYDYTPAYPMGSFLS